MTKEFENFSHTQAQQTGQKTYYCDSVEDIATLPTDGTAEVGSVAIVVDTDCPTYMLNPSHVWVQIG